MRKVFILSAAAAVALTLASADLFAQRPAGPVERNGERPRMQGERPGPGNPRAGGPGRLGGRFGGPLGRVALRGLDLTEDQKTQVAAIVSESREDVHPIVEELRAARLSLRDAIFADGSDPAAVESLTQKVTELERRMTDIRNSRSTAIADVLTSEQREMLRGRTGPGAERGGPGRGPGRGPSRGAAGTRG